MSEIKLACDVVKQVRAICDRHGNQPGELINILHEAQHLHGYLPKRCSVSLPPNWVFPYLACTAW